MRRLEVEELVEIGRKQFARLTRQTENEVDAEIFEPQCIRVVNGPVAVAGAMFTAKNLKELGIKRLYSEYGSRDTKLTIGLKNIQRNRLRVVSIPLGTSKSLLRWLSQSAKRSRLVRVGVPPPMKIEATGPQMAA